MLIDAHCHLASAKFLPEERGEVIARAMAAGVGKMVTMATSLRDVEENLALATLYDVVRTGLGIHPCDVHLAPDDAVEQLRAYGADERVCAVGETGLDYYHAAPEGWVEEDFRERQKWMLEQHFAWAAECGLGVVVHTRDRSGCDSFEDAMGIYARYASRVRAMFHCFIGSAENARWVLEMGGIVSFGGVATFKNARDVLDVVSGLPQGTFALETDAPYLAPVPHRGQRNEPAMVRHTAECIAAARGESLEELCAHTARAAAGFFRW
jgi:TatD DNase family protein